MDRITEYHELLDMTYEKAINYLLEKYGEVYDDYFREQSYKRFLNNEIKSITKGNHSRTDDGLIVHHIDEDKVLNLTNQWFIEEYEYSFDHQRKEKLVYCDVVEHTILHAIIANETNFKYGLPGYETYLKIDIIEWYLEKNIPNLKWKKNCYEKSFLTRQQAVDILKRTEILTNGEFINTPEEWDEIRQDENKLTKFLGAKYKKIRDSK